jgi:hypothetical protein
MTIRVYLVHIEREFQEKWSIKRVLYFLFEKMVLCNNINEKPGKVLYKYVSKLGKDVNAISFFPCGYT